MKVPAISVIMPCFNSAKFLNEAIESILIQTFESFEFIIINDGSSDQTHEIITKYIDSRIRYIRFEKNEGNYVARNKGISVSKGRFICVMDADDIAHNDRLKIQYDFMIKHPNVGCLGCDANIIDQEGNNIGKVSNPIFGGKKLSTYFLLDNYMLHPSLFIRKRLIVKHNLNYNTDLVYSSDYEFVCKCANHFMIKNIKDVLMNYRHHTNQISISNKEKQRYYANQVRINQLKKFKLELTDQQKKVYLKLVNRKESLVGEELGTGLKLFNTLLSKNDQMRLYPKKLLFDIFNQLLRINAANSLSSTSTHP